MQGSVRRFICTAPGIGMLINALYNLADTYFVGGLGTNQMGAVTVAFPLGQIVVGLGLLFGNGAAAYLSRLLGRGDKDTANKVASTTIYSGVSIGTIVILFSVIFLEPILKQAGAIESVMPYAITYTRIYIVFSIFNVFNFSIKECCFTREIMSKILKIGIPTLIFQLLTSLSISMINSAAKEYGGSALAAMGPVTKIMSMGTLIVFGFLKGFQPIAGFSHGAKKFDRLREVIKTAVLSQYF